MDDDLAEMARLRQSKTYQRQTADKQRHLEAKRIVESVQSKLELERNQQLNGEDDDSHLFRATKRQRLDDDDGFSFGSRRPQAQQEDPSFDSLRAMFPMQFGQSKGAKPIVFEREIDEEELPKSKNQQPENAKMQISFSASLSTASEPSVPPPSEPLPPASSVDGTSDSDDDFFGPAIPAHLQKPKSSAQPAQPAQPLPVDLTPSASSSLSDDVESEDTEITAFSAVQRFQLPITDRIDLHSQTQHITCITLDSTGTRFVVASMDRCSRFYDFGGMTTELRYFHERFLPHPAVGLSWSPKRDYLLCCMMSPQPMILNRDGGREMFDFLPGYNIADLCKTYGHIANCTGGQWHPSDPGLLYTCGADGTVRQWDVSKLSQKNSKAKQLLCKRLAVLASDRSISCTAICVHPQKHHIVAAGDDQGRVYLLDFSNKQKPNALQQTDPIGSGVVVTSLKFSPDGHHLAGRFMDHAIRVWNCTTLELKQPIHEWPAPCADEHTDCDWLSEDIIMTGSGERATSKDTSGYGNLDFFSRQMDRHVASVRVSLQQPVTRCVYNRTINQIIVGCRDGSCHVLYSTEFSTRGALLAMSKQAKRHHGDITDYMSVFFQFHCFQPLSAISYFGAFQEHRSAIARPSWQASNTRDSRHGTRK